MKYSIKINANNNNINININENEINNNKIIENNKLTIKINRVIFFSLYLI